MRTGYSAFETRYFRAHGRDPFHVEQQYIETPYSEIKYCRPTDDPTDPPAPSTNVRQTFHEYWHYGRTEAAWLRKVSK